MVRPVLLVLATASAALMSACVVAPYSPYGAATYPAEAEIVAPVAPPAPIVEVVPPLPFAGAIWIGGYWGWVGGRHVWFKGRWEHPRPGYRWEPHHWEPHAGGWRLHGGGWRAQ